MAIPIFRVDGEYEEDWVNLEATASGSVTRSDLNAFSLRLQSHLNSRLNQTVFTTPGLAGAVRTGSTANDVFVRASFIDKAGLTTKHTPKPFVVEIQLTQVISIEGEQDGKIVESGHLLFLSAPRRQSPTHYPILLWKAPPSGRAAPLANESDLGSDVAPITVTSRLLTVQTLSFLAAYFDCRLSTVPPLHGIRGKNLEDIAEKVVHQARGQRKTMTMDLTFALPSQVTAEVDSNLEGPSPDLNTISLSIPGPIIEELIQGTPFDTPIMPAIHHYLSSHTSIHLSKLTLTRLGIGNVYLGAPSSIKSGGGEVRMKLSRDADSQSQEDMIFTVLRELVRIAGEEEW
ncbi:hypothetical protein CBS101457_005335 [Exobasidium rhododendri]|nr:hypothetical protein CBS101457_005335 [Exobasidium rhododendri]